MKSSALLAFYDFPAEHWKHIRTSNPIESTFVTVRHRTTRTKGCLSHEDRRDHGIQDDPDCAEFVATSRGSEPVAKLITGIKFTDGIEAGHIRRRLINQLPVTKIHA